MVKTRTITRTRTNVKLPFLTTHVANIALNKQLGLVFLMQNPQTTCGLTEVSEESLRADQLAVAAWMMKAFAPFSKTLDDAKVHQPWMQFRPFTGGLEAMMHVDHGAIQSHREVVEQIDAQRLALGDKLWHPENEDGWDFRGRVVAQIDECVAYTAGRVDAIKECAVSGDMGSAIGYLAIKNAITPPMMFTSDFLKVVRWVVVDPAIEYGYTQPVCDEEGRG
jgi:hypothetical protein